MNSYDFVYLAQNAKLAVYWLRCIRLAKNLK